MSNDDDTLAAASQRVGTVLRGKYRIERVLGVGGMAVVYAATHRNRKRFAVKMLHAELSVRRNIRARFLREGYVANSVNHPGVVAILDDDVDEDGSAFLVMELLEGATVEALCWRSRSGLAVREALTITHRVLDVMGAAHASAIIHRDIKPANLFVTRDGQVKVLDFGIARLRDAAAGIKSTRSGAIIGTPGFMAPEQVLAQGSDVDARTDVWAVGATLFTMLSRRFVHESDNGRQMLIRAATVPARSLTTVAPDTPTAVVELVAKALEFDKAMRWESAVAMRDAVARVQGELFGPPARGHLESLVEETRVDIAGIQIEPTEAGPDGTSGTAATVAVAGVPDTIVTAPSDPAATISHFVAARMDKRAAALRGRGAPAILVTIAAMLAASGLAWLSVTRSPRGVASRMPAPTQLPSVTPAPRIVNLPTDPTDSLAHVAASAGSEPGSAPGAAHGLFETGPATPRVHDAALFHAPWPHASTAPPLNPARPFPPRAASSAAVRAASVAPSASHGNPLELDFQ